MDKPKILVVDDEVINLHLMGNLLSSHYTVLIATNGEDALIKADEAQPAFILLDIMMPDMDGFEVCHWLKNNASTKHIPVAFVTTCNSDYYRHHAFNLGAVNYFQKPIEPDVISKQIALHITT